MLSNRKTCKSCGCERLQHAVYHEELGSVRDRLGLRDATRANNHHAYDWAPPGLTAKQVNLWHFYWSLNLPYDGILTLVLGAYSQAKEGRGFCCIALHLFCLIFPILPTFPYRYSLSSSFINSMYA